MDNENKNLLAQQNEPASQVLVDKMKEESLGFFNPTVWQGINLMAKTFFTAGALPKSLDTAPKVIMALQAGKEAGMQPMEALQAFAPINGKMTMYGDAVIAQVAKAGHEITWGKCDKKTATVTIKRCDNGKKMTETWTVEDAKEANIFKNVWLSHPRRMLKYKAFAEVAHFLVPDALKGVIVREFVDEYKSAYIVENKKFDPVINKQIEAPVENESLNEAIDKKPEVEEMPSEESKRLKADIIKDIADLATEKKIEVQTILDKYKKTSLDKFTVKDLLIIEEALQKTPIKEVEPPVVATSILENEGPMAKTVRLKKEKEASKESEAWPADVCKYLRFIDGINDVDLATDIIELKEDAKTGEFGGYNKYPSLKSQIASLPEDVE